jgi:hypothetical protein
MAETAQRLVELAGGARPQDVGRLSKGNALAQVAALLQEAGVVAGALFADVVLAYSSAAVSGSLAAAAWTRRTIGETTEDTSLVRPPSCA